jgi:NAD/NADP transhydrogenase alpha subunit
LKEIVAKSDTIILSALIPGRLAPILIADDMIKSMPAGGAIVDISIDQGGNCEATRPGQIITKYGVSIDGTKNIPGMVPRTSTWMFAHNIYNYLANLVKVGCRRPGVGDVQSDPRGSRRYFGDDQRGRWILGHSSHAENVQIGRLR